MDRRVDRLGRALHRRGRIRRRRVGRRGRQQRRRVQRGRRQLRRRRLERELVMARHPRWVRGFLARGRPGRGGAGHRDRGGAHLRRDPRAPRSPLPRRRDGAGGGGLRAPRHAPHGGPPRRADLRERRTTTSWPCSGDQGIHERVGQAYWEQLVQAVLAHFREERPRDGLLARGRRGGRGPRPALPAAAGRRQRAVRSGEHRALLIGRGLSARSGRSGRRRPTSPGPGPASVVRIPASRARRGVSL